MTIIEKQSARKKKSIIYLVNNGEYSVGYALLKVEELNDAGKLTEEDYEELAEWLEGLLEQSTRRNNRRNTRRRIGGTI